MSQKNTCASILVDILEKNGVSTIFGHPGEQVLGLYDALRTSKIEHVLVRHEQTASHAADGYSRASGNIGVCLSTAGPGAMNLVMGVATAYRDSVPMLIITGDVPVEKHNTGAFQDIDICSLFENITYKSFYCSSAKEAIINMCTAFELFKKGAYGPIHINLPKDVLEGEFSDEIPTVSVDMELDDDFDLDLISNLISSSKKPLIIAGAGVVWGDATQELTEFARKTGIPVATTYHAKGVIPESEDICLGLIGTRGNAASNFAGKNADLIIGLGLRFSERTIAGIENETKTIHVNINRDSLCGDINICMDVKSVLDKLNSVDIDCDVEDWFSQLQEYRFNNPDFNKINFYYSEYPIKPQQAVREVLNGNKFKDVTVVNDAGSHVTWLTLYKECKRPRSLIFSGGFGSMGYGLGAAIGVAFSRPNEPVLVVIGDGAFQMNSQDLITIRKYRLPIIMCMINNDALRIVKQWQVLNYGEAYETDLDLNPNFEKLVKSYNIDYMEAYAPGDVYMSTKKAMAKKRACLINILVDKDVDIPLPNDGKSFDEGMSHII